MSRSSADFIDLQLLSDGCRVGTGSRAIVHARPEGEAIWPEALASTLPAKAKVRATIGDSHLRYLVCRWPKTLRGRVEREAWLAHQFRQVHEIDSAQWQIIADADAVDAPFVACAMPRRLETELRALIDRAGARLVSLSGQFVRQFNAHCPTMSETHGALVVVEGGRMTLGSWRDGHWTRVVSRPMADGDADVAARELAQLKVTGEVAANGTLYVCGARMGAPAGWNVSVMEIA